MNSNNIYNYRCHSLLNRAEYYSCVYDLPLDLAGLVCTKPARFEEMLMYYDNETVLNALNACIDEEWGEGVVIVEQEIARRGLHVEDNEERFELWRQLVRVESEKKA